MAAVMAVGALLWYLKVRIDHNITGWKRRQCELYGGERVSSPTMMSIVCWHRSRLMGEERLDGTSDWLHSPLK